MHPRLHNKCNFSHITCIFVTIQLSVGAYQDLSSRSPKRSFHGCLENLMYNNLNLIELAKLSDHQVTVMVRKF